MKNLRHETASKGHETKEAAWEKQRFSRRALAALLLHCSLLIAAVSCEQPSGARPAPQAEEEPAPELGYIEIRSAADLGKIGSGPGYPLDGDYRIPAGTRELKLRDWAPIGTAEQPFAGKLSGNGAAITIESFAPGAASLGLFGFIRGAELQGLAVAVNAGEAALGGDGDRYAGALAGHAAGGALRSLSAAGALRLSKTGGGALYAGGLVGYADGAAFEDCASGLNIRAEAERSAYAGGLAGRVVGPAAVAGSSALGDIELRGGASHAAYAGGLIGHTDGGLRLSRSRHTAGTVSATAYSAYSGGIAGYAGGAEISESYAAGTVRAEGSTPFAGGVAGFLGGGSVRNAYALAGVSARSATRRALAGGIAGGVGAGGEIATSHAAGRISAEVAGSVPAPTQAAPEGAYAGGVAGAVYGGSVRNSAVLEGGGVAALDAASGGALRARRVGSGDAGALAGNIAWQGLPVAGGAVDDKGRDRQDGEDAPGAPLQAAYEGLGWDFAVWRMGGGGYPVLAGQSFNFGDYIDIVSAEQLAKIGVDNAYPLNGAYRIPPGTADILLSAWRPVGTAERPFAGSFTGNGATLIRVASFAPETAATSAIGLFGYVKGSVRQRAELKGLRVDIAMGETVALGAGAGRHIGGLAGYGEELAIEGCEVSGQLRWRKNDGAPLYCGGLAGYLKNGKIADSASAVTLESEGDAGVYAGGILGYAAGSLSVSNCVSAGAVSARAGTHNSSAGGVVGYILGANDSTVSGCAASGDVSLVPAAGLEAQKLMFYCGGVVGYAGNGTADLGGSGQAGAVIEKSRYAGGTVRCRTGYPYAGGVVGYHYTGSLVRECAASGSVIAEGSSLPYAGGVAGYISGAARVEDSYSRAAVSALATSKQALAGGVAGATAKSSLLSRCYAAGAALARINGSSSEGMGGSLGVPPAANVGGISGSVYYANPRVEKSVALNSSVAGIDDGSGGALLVYRIGGVSPLDGGQPELSNNKAWAGMTVTGGSAADTGLDGQDGEDCAQKPGQAVYTALGWDFGGVWRMGGEGFPVLRWEN